MRVFVAFAALALAAPVGAQTVIERFPPQGALPPEVSVIGVQPSPPASPEWGQTLTVGTAGRLDKVEVLLRGFRPPNSEPFPSVSLALYDGRSGPLLAQGGITVPNTLNLPLQWFGVNVSASNLFVKPGQSLLLALSSDRGVNYVFNWYGWQAPEALSYAGGNPVIRRSCQGTQFPPPGCGTWVDDDLNAQPGYDSDLSFRLTIDTSVKPPVVPEPFTWALMVAGFGLTGTALRRRRLGVA